MEADRKHPIILFDGVCNLCNAIVQFIIKRDRNAVFMFASLQSPFGQKVLSENDMSNSEWDTLLLLANGKIYTKSTAALNICKELNGWWRMLYVLILIPEGLRDVLYGMIARNRYKWFGQKEQCMIPTPELKNRFIE